MLKRCCTCRLELPVEAFSRRRASRDGLQSRCKACWRADYLANTEQRKAVAAASARVALERHRAALTAYLASHPCVDCSESDIRCLDFDHRDPEHKVANVTLMVSMHWRWSRIEAEIEKCDVRCASCHRKRTSEQRGDWRQAQWVEDSAATLAVARARLVGIRG
jgi:hypothetical protein